MLGNCLQGATTYSGKHLDGRTLLVASNRQAAEHDFCTAQVDAVLVVVGDERTKREELMRCFELIREIPVVGTVLNGSRREHSAAYAY